MTTSTVRPRWGRLTKRPKRDSTWLRRRHCSALRSKQRKATMSDIEVLLPDGSARRLSQGSTAWDLAAAIGPRLAKDALAAVVNGELTDLATPLSAGATVSRSEEDT